jgi:phenylalanyl-tRNA synthetase alpha chain
MILFSIPDIRLFWSEDPRFLQQFQPGKVSTFKPYSKYPECYKDVSFWIPHEEEGAKAAGGALGPKPFHENDFCEIVRDVAGDLVEDVKLVSVSASIVPISAKADVRSPVKIDDFVHPKTGRRSKCYRLNYRSMDR